MNEQTGGTLLLQQFLPYRIGILAKRISDACSFIYGEEFGLTIPEWRVLARLGEQPGLNFKEIRIYTFMDKSMVTRAVKSLEEKGYLIKQKGKNDSRVNNLALTESGYDLYRQVAPRVLEWEAELLDALDVPEYRDLFRIMEKLDRRLDGIEEKEREKKGHLRD